LLYPLSFGFFQGLMPLIGYYLATGFIVYIERYDHWIAFALLALIGIKMIWEAFHEKPGNQESCGSPAFSFSRLLLLSVATSIDALAAGISFALLKVKMIPIALLIAATTGILSLIGLKFGHFLGEKSKKLASIIGGCILIAIGLKILLEHIL
jgi:putative Mn2+ efflux pump MntP